MIAEKQNIGWEFHIYGRANLDSWAVAHEANVNNYAYEHKEALLKRITNRSKKENERGA